jgi:2-polyprenyl-6-methoxyphenol hydroxylase-like FAD-dependent oxidoreductase
MYDVIVVGARCAGSPAAMLFARAGYQVLVLDRATVLRDTLSTLYIHQPGVALLNRWQVLDPVVATGCPPIDQASYHVADVRLRGCAVPADGIRTAYAPRRQALDGVLADAAVEAGAELRMGCGVRELVYRDDRVVGVRYQGAEGTVEERARLVVGADGMRSTVASAVKAQLVVDDPTMTCAYYTYWAGVEAGFEIYDAPGSNVGAIPTSSGLTLIGAYFPRAQFDSVRQDAAAAYRDSIRRTAPRLYERILGGEQAERLRGTGDQLNFFREATGPGWVLVGDASHHKDSITARGITDAFVQADLLAESVGADLRDPAKLDAALARYEQERDDALAYSYYSTLSAAELAMPAHKVEMLRQIALDPVLVDRYFGVLAGTCRVEELSLG